MRKAGLALLMAAAVGLVSPGLAAAVETYGTYYNKEECQRALGDQSLKDVTKHYYCASNGGPASSTPTSWTLYGD